MKKYAWSCWRSRARDRAPAVGRAWRNKTRRVCSKRTTGLPQIRRVGDRPLVVHKASSPAEVNARMCAGGRCKHVDAGRLRRRDGCRRASHN